MKKRLVFNEEESAKSFAEKLKKQGIKDAKVSKTCSGKNWRVMFTSNRPRKKMRNIRTGHYHNGNHYSSDQSFFEATSYNGAADDF